MSEFENLVEEFKIASDVKEPPQVKQLQDYVVLDSEAERDTKWVTMLDELPKIVPTAMVSLVKLFTIKKSCKGMLLNIYLYH